MRANDFRLTVPVDPIQGDSQLYVINIRTVFYSEIQATESLQTCGHNRFLLASAGSNREPNGTNNVVFRFHIIAS